MPGELPLSEKVARKWKVRIRDAEQELRERNSVRQHLLKRYSGKSAGASAGGNFSIPPDWVEVNKFFPLVEQKKAQLFYKLPKLQVTPTGLLRETFAEQADIVANSLEDGVNERIGIHRDNLLPNIDKVLFDVLCPAGIGAVEIGYRSVTKPVSFQPGEVDPRQPTIVPEPTMDPLTGEEIPGEEQPNILQEPFETEVPVFEEWFFDHVSVDDLLVPKDFQNTDYEKANWLGVRFKMTRSEAKNRYKLPSDFRPSGNPSDDKFDFDSERASHADDEVSGIRVWYRASAFDSRETNPDIFNRIVFINGLSRPAEHVQSPHQQLDEAGRLTGDSLRGNPVHVLTIRDLSGSAYPPSDAEIIKPLVDELSKGRTMMMRHRDRSVPMNWHDRNRISREDIQKWSTGEIGASLPVDGDGSTAFGELKRASMKPETFQFDSVVNRDIDEVSAMGSNQRGVETAEKKSATELSIVSEASDVRLDKERDRVIAWFLLGVTRKLIPLYLRYSTLETWAAIVGEQAGQAIMQLTESGVDVAHALRVLPDSGAHFDSQVRLANLKDLYEFTAKDPNVNRIPILREMISLAGMDPAEVLVEEVPEQSPPPPNVSLRASGDDLNPTMPQFEVMRSVLEQMGITIPEEAIEKARMAAGLMGQLQALMQPQGPAEGQPGAPGAPEHGGLAPKVEPLSKNAAEETGGTSGLPGEGT